MKEFMVFVWVLIFGATFVIITGCTTFQSTQDSIRKACKSGVDMYDDGNVSYRCKSKDERELIK